MARPGISQGQFNQAMEQFVASGTPASKVTLRMLAEKLAASNSTLLRFKNLYTEAHPVTVAVTHALPGDVVAGIVAYADRREALAREDLGEQLSQAKAAESALLAEVAEVSAELEELRTAAADVATKNATLAGQNGQQALELTNLRADLIALGDRAAGLKNELHTAQAEAQAAQGRVDEIRTATSRQLQKMEGELGESNVARARAEARAADAEKRAGVLEAQLAAERTARALVESQAAELGKALAQSQAKGHADALRAATAEATAAGLREQVTMLIREIKAEDEESSSDALAARPGKRAK